MVDVMITPPRGSRTRAGPRLPASIDAGPVLTRGTPSRTQGLPVSKPGLCADTHDLPDRLANMVWRMYSDVWAEWHTEHERRRSAPHGFLAVTGLHWLSGSPRSFEDVPGEWSSSP